MTMVAPSYEGLTLTGRYLASKQEADRAVGDRTYAGRFKVTLLTGERTVQVEYRDEDAFLAAVGGGQPEAMDELNLTVGVRSAKGYTFFFGRRAD